MRIVDDNANHMVCTKQALHSPIETLLQVIAISRAPRDSTVSTWQVRVEPADFVSRDTDDPKPPAHDSVADAAPSRLAWPEQTAGDSDVAASSVATELVGAGATQAEGARGDA